MPVMARQVARFQARWNAQGGSVPPIWRLAVHQRRIRQRPQRGGRYPSQQSAEKRSAVIGAGCNARNVRAIKTDIGQFAIAKLGQFADIALIVPEGLDHADEREQHGVVSLYFRFNSWRKLDRWYEYSSGFVASEVPMVRCS